MALHSVGWGEGLPSAQNLFPRTTKSITPLCTSRDTHTHTHTHYLTGRFGAYHVEALIVEVDVGQPEVAVSVSGQTKIKSTRDQPPTYVANMAL